MGKLLGGAAGFITGGPAGAARAVFGDVIRGGGSSARTTGIYGPVRPGVGAAVLDSVRTRTTGAWVGGAKGFGIGTGDSTSYYSQAGGRGLCRGRPVRLKKNGKPRKCYKSMNPLNPRALKRAMRRVKGFSDFAHQTMTFTAHHKMKRHAPTKARAKR